MFCRNFTELALILVVCAALVSAADNEKGWKVLKEQITRRRNYNFLLREGRCLSGWIEKVGGDGVEVTTSGNGKPARRRAAARLLELVVFGAGCWLARAFQLPSANR
jgi:hypothetical protein